MISGPRKLMAYEKALKWQILNGSLARRLIVRGFILTVAISALPLLQIVCGFSAVKLYPATFDECSFELGYLSSNSIVGRVLNRVTSSAFPHVGYARCRENVNVAFDVVRELLDKHLLNYGSRALCLGPESGSSVLALRELGFVSVEGVYRHPLFARKMKEAEYELDYEDNSFDLLIARDLDMVSVPALFVSEMERVLKPGGIGAVVLGADGLNRGSLIRSAMPVSPFLKSSSVVHVASLNAKNTLVAFKKNFDHTSLLVEHLLPADCPSLRRNNPYIDRMEPLVEAKPAAHRNGSEVSYLPSFIGVTDNMRLVYVDMGKKEAANFSDSNWFLPSYPIDSRAFSVYIVDHNVSVLSSHVQKPGIYFIYHPDLFKNSTATSDSSTDERAAEFPASDEEFDFLAWFKEIILYTDFVVLKMTAGQAELKFLADLFESGAICSLDELFLECPDKNLGESCMDLFRNLRSAGVFVHQWW